MVHCGRYLRAPASCDIQIDFDLSFRFGKTESMYNVFLPRIITVKTMKAFYFSSCYIRVMIQVRLVG